MNENIYTKIKQANVYTDLTLKRVLPFAALGAGVGGLLALVKHKLSEKENEVPAVTEIAMLPKTVVKEKITSKEAADVAGITHEDLFGNTPNEIKDIPYRHAATAGGAVLGMVGTYMIVKKLLERQAAKKLTEHRDIALKDLDKTLAEESAIAKTSEAIDILYNKIAAAADIYETHLTKTGDDKPEMKKIDPKLLGTILVASMATAGIAGGIRGYMTAPERQKAKALKAQKAQLVYRTLEKQPYTPIIEDETE